MVAFYCLSDLWHKRLQIFLIFYRFCFLTKVHLFSNTATCRTKCCRVSTLTLDTSMQSYRNKSKPTESGCSNTLNITNTYNKRQSHHFVWTTLFPTRWKHSPAWLQCRMTIALLMKIQSLLSKIIFCGNFYFLYKEKSVPLQHQNQERVRSVNVMNATYSNGMMVCAPAEAKSLATFTPPL